MKSDKGVKFRRRLMALAVLVLLLFLLLINVNSANGMNDLMWVTVCHTPPGHPEQAQTMVVYWSALDKCLSFFGDTIGACPN